MKEMSPFLLSWRSRTAFRLQQTNNKQHIPSTAAPQQALQLIATAPQELGSAACMLLASCCCSHAAAVLHTLVPVCYFVPGTACMLHMTSCCPDAAALSLLPVRPVRAACMMLPCSCCLVLPRGSAACEHARAGTQPLHPTCGTLHSRHHTGTSPPCNHTVRAGTHYYSLHMGQQGSRHSNIFSADTQVFCPHITTSD